MASFIKTLLDSTRQNQILPRTKLKAIFDEQGNYLSDTLTADDLNNVPTVTENFNSLGLSVVNGELSVTYEE